MCLAKTRLEEWCFGFLEDLKGFQDPLFHQPLNTFSPNATQKVKQKHDCCSVKTIVILFLPIQNRFAEHTTIQGEQSSCLVSLLFLRFALCFY